MTRLKFSFRLNADLVQPLAEMARQRQTTKNSVANTALREYFEKYGLLSVRPTPVETSPIGNGPGIVFLSRFDDNKKPRFFKRNHSEVTL